MLSVLYHDFKCTSHNSYQMLTIWDIGISLINRIVSMSYNYLSFISVVFGLSLAKCQHMLWISRASLDIIY